LDHLASSNPTTEVREPTRKASSLKRSGLEGYMLIELKTKRTIEKRHTLAKRKKESNLKERRAKVTFSRKGGPIHMKQKGGVQGDITVNPRRRPKKYKKRNVAGTAG